MSTSDIIKKTEDLIDALRATCGNNGLSGDGNEYKIVVQMFLYKFLNDKFGYELKHIQNEEYRSRFNEAAHWESAYTAMTDEEREAMAVQNSPFQEADNLVKMVSMLYAAPPKGKKVKATYIDAIIDRLMKEYPYWTPGEHVNQDVGIALQDAGFTRTRIHGRSAYKVVEKDPRKIDESFDNEPKENEEENFDNNPLARALLAGLGGLKKP